MLGFGTKSGNEGCNPCDAGNSYFLLLLQEDTRMDTALNLANSIIVHNLREE